MIRLKMEAKDMGHIVPVEDWEWEKEIKNPPELFEYSMSDLLVDRNGKSQINNLRRAHYQLKDFLSLAVTTAEEKEIALSEIEILSPQLLDSSAWGGYMGSPWDAECNWRKLTEWFEEKYEKDFIIVLNANSFSNEGKKSYQILINFSQRTNENNHSITC